MDCPYAVNELILMQGLLASKANSEIKAVYLAQSQ